MTSPREGDGKTPTITPLASTHSSSLKGVSEETWCAHETSKSEVHGPPCGCVSVCLGEGTLNVRGRIGGPQ